VKPASSKVKQYFHRRADQFDSLYEEDSWWHCQFNRLFRAGLYERVRFTLRELQGMEDFSVLDVGCGSGRNSALFARAGARRVLGIDFSARMIELAEDYCRRKGTTAQCEFVQADFLDYDFREAFDVAVALGVFDYLSDPHTALRKLRAVAKCKIIASFPGVSPVRAPLRKLRYALRSCPVYFYSATQLRELCRQVGLKDYSLVPYASSGWLVVGKNQEESG